jgi:hypothetical protein
MGSNSGSERGIFDVSSLSFNPVSKDSLAKNLLLLPPAEIIVAFIWASLHNWDAPVA